MNRIPRPCFETFAQPLLATYVKSKFLSFLYDHFYLLTRDGILQKERVDATGCYELNTEARLSR